jgi:hypothetical protein
MDGPRHRLRRMNRPRPSPRSVPHHPQPHLPPPRQIHPNQPPLRRRPPRHLPHQIVSAGLPPIHRHPTPIPQPEMAPRRRPVTYPVYHAPAKFFLAGGADIPVRHSRRGGFSRRPPCIRLSPWCGHSCPPSGGASGTLARHDGQLINPQPRSFRNLLFIF